MAKAKQIILQQQALLLLVVAALIIVAQPPLLTDAARVFYINNAIADTLPPSSAIDVDAADNVCSPLGSVCTLDKECCSESCLLLFCVVPYEKKVMKKLKGNAAHIISKKIALQEKAPTCLVFGSVCTKDTDCCSDSCVVFLCALPYEKEHLMTPMDTKQLAISEKAATCLPFGGVCSKDDDCCSDSCLLFLCALPYEQNKKLEVDGKKVAKPDEDKKAELSLTQTI